MQQYTDFAGKPIKVGDKVAFATKHGNSAALELRTVDEIIELVPHHTHNRYFMRYDQRHKMDATVYRAYSRQPDKLYVVKLNDSGGQVVTKIENVVVIG